MTRHLAILLLCFAALCGNAATYYLSTTGNDANAGTEAQPWASLNYSVNSLSAGDTLLIRGGMYHGITNTAYIEPSNNSGKSSPSLTTTIKAYTGEVPVFDYNLNQPLTAQYRNSILFLDSVTNWVISGLFFSNVLSAMQVYDSDSNVISQCSITGMAAYTNGYAAANIGRGSKYNRILFNTVTNWGHFTADNADDPKVVKGTSFYIGNGAANELSMYNLVASNYFEGIGHDLLQVDSPYCVMRWNRFKNAPWLPTNSLNYLAFVASGGGEQLNTYGYYAARHVKTGDADAAAGQYDQRQVWEDNTHIYTGPPADGTRAAVFYEVTTQAGIYRRGRMSLSIGGAFYIFNQTGHSRSNSIYNNTIFKGGLGNPHGFTEMAGYYGRDITFNTPTHSNNVFANNIAFGNYTGVHSAGADEAVQIWSSNLFNIDPKFYNTNVGAVTTISGFLASAATNAEPDLRINTNSPAVDAGAWLAYCTNSASGTTLPLSTTLPFSDGNRIVEGDTIQLQWSTNTARVLSNDWENAVLHLDSSLSWTNGQGVSLQYNGYSPDIGYWESDGIGAEPPPDTVATPAISPAGMTFTNSISVSITCSTAGASIYYTLNGATPSQSSTAYSGAITVSSSLTLKAKAFKTGATESGVASATFDLYTDPAPSPADTNATTSVRLINAILR